VAQACRNAYLSLIRKPSIPIIDDSNETVIDEADSEVLLSVTDILKIRKTINLLDTDEKELVQLRFFERKSWQQVGDFFGISANTAQHRWQMTILRRMNRYWQQLLKQFIKELSIIDAYAALQKWNITRSESGLSYLILQIGYGANAALGDKVCMNAKSQFTNNEILEAEQEQELKLGNSNNLAGLEEGLTYFKENSKGVLLMPSLLGYAEHPLNKDKSEISNNGVLIYNILVKKITPKGDC
jgi:FKBP-type peptidyl-prolyl cis-trans isomerase